MTILEQILQLKERLNEPLSQTEREIIEQNIRLLEMDLKLEQQRSIFRSLNEEQEVYPFYDYFGVTA